MAVLAEASQIALVGWGTENGSILPTRTEISPEDFRYGIHRRGRMHLKQKLTPVSFTFSTKKKNKYSFKEMGSIREHLESFFRQSGRKKVDSENRSSQV